MASCYDCIHCDVCAGIGSCSYIRSDVSKCKFFKNKNDVEEVVRGHWVENKPNPKQMQEFHDMGIGKAMALNSIYWTCSECNGWGTLIYSFCPHCGAKMDGGEEK